MNRFVNVVCCLGFVTAFVLPACGGATADSTTYSSGLPPDKSLGDLGAVDGANLCTSLASYLRKGPGAALCKFSGLLAASFRHGFPGSAGTESEVRTACTDTQASCERSLRSDLGSSGCVPPPSGSSCTATVREYEACVSEEFATLEQALTGVPECSSLTLADLEPVSFDGGTVRAEINPSGGRACTLLKERCPAAFASSGGSSGSRDFTSGGSRNDAGVFDAGAFGGTCGNGVAEPGEPCDSTDLGGFTCSVVTMGAHPNGRLSCSPSCQLDLTGCT
jgi:hypothetical protein